MDYFLGFKKRESIAVTIILLVLFVAIAINLRVSFRKSRDVQRKADIRQIHDAVIAFQEKYGFFPEAKAGKIVACNLEFNEEEEPIFQICDWGWEGIEGVIERLPSDPQHSDGARYHYLSNKSRFQIYASLESEVEAEYDQAIADRVLTCGAQTCNFGRAYSKTPLDKSIEEYENELRRNEKN